MDIHCDKVQDDVLIVVADGTLNKDSAEDLVEQIGKLVDGGLRKVIIDFSKVEHISSHGLGVLVRLHRTMDDRHGDVKMACLKGMIAGALRMTRLDKMFQIYPDVESALAEFKKVKKMPFIFR